MDEALKQLHDLHLPAQPNFWPPAPGWWALAAVMVALLIWQGLRFYRMQQRRRPFRIAMNALNQLLASADRNETTPREFTGAVNALLKRALIHGAHRPDAAPLTGTAWLDYLDKIAASDTFSNGSGAALGNARFSRDFHSDTVALHGAALQVLRELSAERRVPS